MTYMEQYKYWCEDDYFDDATRAELAKIAKGELTPSPRSVMRSARNTKAFVAAGRRWRPSVQRMRNIMQA